MKKQIYKKWKEQDIVISLNLDFLSFVCCDNKARKKKNSHVKKDLKNYNSILINKLGFIRMNHTHILRVRWLKVSLLKIWLVWLMLWMNDKLILTEASHNIKLMPHEESAGKQASQPKRLKLENRGISKARFAKYLHHITGHSSISQRGVSQYREMLIKRYIFYYT
jgi:hypothetical protein